MKLPFGNFRKKVESSHFLVLVLRDEKVNAVVFEELEGKIRVIGQKEEYFKSSIDEVDIEGFLETLDKAISSAESSLPENIKTQKTIFGVKESWAHEDQIKKEYLVKLKKASEDLELTPIGFLVIPQAIAHLLQKEEGAPVSAILIEVNKKSVTVTLLRAGKLVETKTSEIHESISFSVDTLLKHFNIPEILPSRMIILDGEDLSQEFIAHSWSKSLPFLHLPQITNLPEGFDAKAVLFGVAAQMGFEVLQKDMPKIQEINIEPIANYSTENFGFTRDVDVAKVKEKMENLQVPTEKHIDQKPHDGKINLKKINILAFIMPFVIKTFKIVRKIRVKKAGKLTIVIPVILILFVGIFTLYTLVSKAEITINIDPQISEKSQNITFSPISPTDPTKNIIKGEFVSVSHEGSVSGASSGKKDVGTKAKGSITVFNSLSQSKSLAEGTIVKTNNDLAFALDSSLTIKGVASHSADENPPPEKATVNVTAIQIGKESNLPSGTKFNVSSFDITDLVAKNDNPFSGGTKKEITVVSEEDINKLEIELPKQLEKNAKENLEKKLSEGKILLPIFIKTSLTKKDFSAKAGEEATQITLKGTVEYQGISYNKKDLITFSKSLLEKDVSSNQEIDYNNIKTSVKDIKDSNSDDVNASLRIKALVLPKVDEEKLTKEIKGNSFTKVRDILEKLPQVSNIDISLSPNIPFLPQKLPVIQKNIKILIKVNG